MSNAITYIAVFSTLLPIGIGIMRWHYISPVYYPFLIFLVLDCINDIISAQLIRSSNNMANSNIYVLIEYYLLLWQLKKWDERLHSRYLIAVLGGLFVWVLDNLILHSLFNNNSLFRMIYASSIVLFSIDQLNRIVVYEKKQIFYNATFLLCITFMMYYGLKAYIESFNLYHLNVSREFYSRLWMIVNIVNVTANILYSLAILCIRPKKTLLLPY